MTVELLRDMERENPQMPQYIHRLTCRSYTEFLTTLYVTLDHIGREFESDANVMQGSTENALNADIARQLRCAGYTAHFDKNKRGHADITVEYATYVWIGEGKIVHSANNSYLQKGYDQIIHRYASGTVDSNAAALIVYCFGANRNNIMNVWNGHLTECNLSAPGYANPVTACDHASPHHSFLSSHDHTSSGSKINVKHLGISLHWQPAAAVAVTPVKKPKKTRAAPPTTT